LILALKVIGYCGKGKKNPNKVLEYLKSVKGEVDLPAYFISHAVLKFSWFIQKSESFFLPQLFLLNFLSNLLPH